jgi:diphosphomevalonate decarboxylase
VQQSATAIACSNIALVKYWGKSPRGGNLTAVPSLSLTLSALRTRTQVQFDERLAADSAEIGGQPATGRSLERIGRLLEEVRSVAGISCFASVTSRNDFPTASGLASSASGFCALALAAQSAAGLSLSEAEVSRLARRASASAARSVFPGFVELLAEAESATPIAPLDFLPVQMLVAVTTLQEKALGSTEGMLHTQATSPYYPAWCQLAPDVFNRAKQALLARDLEALGVAMEESTLAMHGSMFAARPGFTYLNPTTVRVIEHVRALRAAGTLAYFTMDAGPHVKVLVEATSAARLVAVLREIPGVENVLASAPGPGATLVDGE